MSIRFTCMLVDLGSELRFRFTCSFLCRGCAKRLKRSRIGRPCDYPQTI